jgi:alkylhydroperoxidase family enzyme
MPTFESRMSDPTKLIPEVTAVSAATVKAVSNGSISQNLMNLLTLRAGQLVGSTYLTVMAAGNLRRGGETEERIATVASWPTSPYLTEAEQVALELLEAVLTPSTSTERVPDELHARVAKHYDEKAFWTLIHVISQINYYIPPALIGRPIPGTAPGKGYTK